MLGRVLGEIGFMLPLRSRDTRQKPKSMAIPSSTAQIRTVIKTLENFLNQNGVSNDFISETIIAVSEATANAIIHGNRHNLDKNVHISYKLDKNTLNIKIRDEGTGFNPKALPDPREETNRMKTSGRGIYLMRVSVDEVNFKKFTDGMQVELIKYISK